MKCHRCDGEKTTRGDRVPRGWKRHKEQVWCDACWNAAFILRAITIPIVGPTDPDRWPEFRKVLREAWVESTRLANWAVDELYSRDVRRNGEAKCPAQPKTYLYPEAREFAPTLPSQTTAALLQNVGGKYRKARYEVVWTRERAIPTHRYPYPFTCPNQGWGVEFVDGRPVVSVRIGEERWSLLLRGGHEFYRQLAAVRQVASGDAVKGELAILRVRARESDHRNGDGQQWRIMVKMVAWLPRPPQTKREGVLKVRTTADSLLIAVDEKGERIWVENCDHVRRWVTEHARRLQRWGEDTKAEQRPVPSFARRRDAAVEKQHNRLHSAMQEIASHVARFAERRKYAEVEYDDSNRAFVPSFPWYRFAEIMANKLDGCGIKFRASAPVVKDTAGDAREDVSHE